MFWQDCHPLKVLSRFKFSYLRRQLGQWCLIKKCNIFPIGPSNFLVNIDKEQYSNGMSMDTVILVPRACRFLVRWLQIKPSGSGDENGTLLERGPVTVVCPKIAKILLHKVS